MRKIYLILPLLFSLLVIACDDDAEIVRLANEDPVLSVSNISPQRGYAGTEVTIEGTNFGAAKELVEVFFAGMEESVELLTCEDTKLVVRVPENAVSGPITIVANKMRIITTDDPFTVIPDPEMTAISPVKAVGNTEITITGKSFGTVKDDVKLYCVIEDEEVFFVINSCTDEEIKAIVPETAVFGEFDLNLAIQGKAAKNTLKITLLEKPTITKVTSNNVLSENFASAGDKVTISGTGFGTNSSAVSVKFGDMENVASIESCENEKIVAIVPDGFAGGKVTVTKDELSSTSAGELNVLGAGTDISAYVLKNYKAQFISAEFKEGQGSDVWSVAAPADWIVNEASQSQLNRYQNKTWCTELVGGLFMNANGEGVAVGMQAGWNNDSDSRTQNVNNGKMYQVVTLPKGSYTLEVTYSEVVLKGDPYVAVSKNVDELPNPKELDETNGDVFWKFVAHDKKNQPGTHTLSFELSETMKVCLGFTANLANKSCFKVTELKLVYVGATE